MTSPFEDGVTTAKIAVIAEAPSYAEMAASRPLVGASGSVFESCLHSAGIARAEIYVGNVSRKPISGEKELLTTKGWTEKGADEFRLLSQRLNLLNANVLVPLGNTALYALTGKRGISKYRGSILECTIAGMEGRKVIPTYHPAAVLRGQSIWQYDMVLDFCKAKKNSQYRTRGFVKEKEIITDPTYEETLEYLSICRESEIFSNDIEVYNHQISCISFSHNSLSGISIPFYDIRQNKNHRWVSDAEEKIWLEIERTLRSPGRVVGQNYLFDLSILIGHNKIVPTRKIEDTMIAHSIMYPDLPKGLAYLCSIYTDIPYYKDDRKLWDKLDSREEAQEAFWRYSALDSIATMQVWEELEGDLKEDPFYKKTYERTISLTYPLLEMQQRGIYVDTEGVERERKETEKSLTEMQAILDDISDYSFNPISPAQCIKYFYQHKNLTPYTKNGKPTIDDNALARLYKRDDVEEAKVVQRIRNLKKFQGTSLNMNLDEDKRMRCSVNLRGTRFGRISTGKTIFGNGGNMQNIDPRFKNYLKADKGKALFEFDKAGAEWVITAYLTGDPNMLAVCNSSVSPHVATAQLMFRVGEEVIEKEDSILGHLTSPSEIASLRREKIPELLSFASPFIPRNMSLRQAAKRANHGLNYGLQYRTFALYYDLKEADARRICSLYHAAYPGIQNWHCEIRNTLKDNNRTLVNPFGRKYKFLGRLDINLYLSAYSFLPQSTNADTLNDGVISIYEDPKLEKWELLAHIHDSLLFQHPIPRKVEDWLSLWSNIEKISNHHLSPTIKTKNGDFKLKTTISAGRGSWGTLNPITSLSSLKETISP